jgi:MoxR-like ATPase
LLRIRVGYPDRPAELELLARRLERGQDEVELETVVDRDELLAMQRAVERVHADAGILGYAVDLVTATRESAQVQVGASPRGTLALLKLARAKAGLDGRDFVTPDDVKRIAVPALAHRITLRPELWIQRVNADDVVRDCLDSCPAPAVGVRDEAR